MEKFEIEQSLVDLIISKLSLDERTAKIIQFWKSLRMLCNFLAIWIIILLFVEELNLPTVLFSVFFLSIFLLINILVIKKEKEYRNDCLQFIGKIKENKDFVISNLNRFRLYRKLSEEKQHEVKEEIISLLGREYTGENYKDLIDSRFDNFNDFEYTNDAELLARLFINNTDI